MIEHVAFADHNESAIRYRTEQLQETCVTRAIDANGTNNGAGQLVFEVFKRKQLAIQF